MTEYETSFTFTAYQGFRYGPPPVHLAAFASSTRSESTHVEAEVARVYVWPLPAQSIFQRVFG